MPIYRPKKGNLRTHTYIGMDDDDALKPYSRTQKSVERGADYSEIHRRARAASLLCM